MALVTNIIIGESTEFRPHSSEFSLKFDISLGVYLEALAKVLKDHYNIEPQLLRDQSIEYMRDHLPNWTDYFSSHVYHVGIMDPINHRHHVIINDEIPKWRPS